MKTIVRKIFTRSVHEKEIKKKYLSAYEVKTQLVIFYLVKHSKVFNLDILFFTPLMTSEKSWQSGQLPSDWRKRDITPIFKTGRNEDPRNSQPVSFLPVPIKIMEQMPLEVNLKHKEDR